MTEPDNTQQHVLTRTEDGIYRIQLNRPEKKNALTHAMYSTLVAALEEAGADESVRVVLLTGTPGCFSAGNDVMDFMGAPVFDDTSPVIRFLHGIPESRKPIVAAVSGIAIGIGATMLLHCDLVYAASDTRFQMPFVNLGICPEAASSYLLPRIMGYPRAAELLLLGQPFDAETARSVGIVNAVCAPDEVETLALEKARLLAAQPPAAVRAARALLNRATQAIIRETIEVECEMLAECIRSPEAAEAFQAFAQRRKPDFSRFK
ncbi:MAG: enoyl-CoA hydratase [Nitrospiraceae bacterium]|nr:enoyl-CoA hydratase [Nitrospiraceae bacterium]